VGFGDSRSLAERRAFSIGALNDPIRMIELLSEADGLYRVAFSRSRQKEIWLGFHVTVER